MKLVMMLNQFPKFSETFIVNKFLGLRARGWDVSAICNRSEPEQWAMFPDLAAIGGIEDRVHVERDDRNISRILKEIKPDIVHFEFGNLALGRMNLPGDVGAASVVSFRGPDLNFLWRDQPGCYDEIWEAVDGVHVLGADLWARAVRLGCPDDIVHGFIHAAVDTAYFDPGDRRHADAAGTAERPLRILSVGRLHWMKGYEYNLQTVRRLIDAGLHCEYRVLGGHDHREHLLEVLYAIEDTRLGDVVDLRGRQSRDDVKDSMQWADVLLHGAVSEGFCNAVIEAQAMAVPVVTSDADGLRENVADGVTGYVVPRRDTVAAATRLSALAADPALRQRVGAAGRRRAERDFRLAGQIDKFDALYRAVLASSSEKSQLARLRKRLAERQQKLAELQAELDQLGVAPRLTRAS